MTKQNKLENQKGLSSFTLHLLAMSFMLCDHLWATLFIQYDLLTSIGRIAFPIFAFLIAEGAYHTHDLKKYIQRLFAFALISELPFNLMYSGSMIYPFHQNVLWTFLIALIGIYYMERLREYLPRFVHLAFIPVIVLLGYVLGYLFMTDYYGEGILTVFTFYIFYGRRHWQRLVQFIVLFGINYHLLGGLVLEFSIGTLKFDWPQQAFALLALIPIWCYSGKQGYYNHHVRRFYYWFYPVHALLLGLAVQLLP